MKAHSTLDGYKLHYEFLDKEPAFYRPCPRRIKIAVRALGIPKIVIVNTKNKIRWAQS